MLRKAKTPSCRANGKQEGKLGDRNTKTPREKLRGFLSLSRTSRQISPSYRSSEWDANQPQACCSNFPHLDGPAVSDAEESDWPIERTAGPSIGSQDKIHRGGVAPILKLFPEHAMIPSRPCHRPLSLNREPGSWLHGTSIYNYIYNL